VGVVVVVVVFIAQLTFGFAVAVKKVLHTLWRFIFVFVFAVQI